MHSIFTWIASLAQLTALVALCLNANTPPDMFDWSAIAIVEGTAIVCAILAVAHRPTR